MKQPLVSIITVVYNGEKTIEKTIQSVINQTYKNIEYIIIDGNSTDSTVDIIKQYANNISYFISEKDDGIYDAMNKGLKKSSGEIIAILNADDWYEPNAVRVSVDNLYKEEIDYTYSSIEYHKNLSRQIIHPLAASSFKKKALYEMPYPHITAFIKKNVYTDIGYFDTSFRIAGDHDMAIRIIQAGYKGYEIHETIAHALADGISSDFKANIEFFRVAKKNNANISIAYMMLLKQYFIYNFLKYAPINLIKTIQKLKKSRFQ